MTDDDLLSVVTDGKERLGPAPRDPVDAMVRTVYGEADNDPASRQAVAGVIHNRASRSGKSYDQVVAEPGQFEAWNRPDARARMEALDPNSPDYQAIKAQIEPVISGQVSVPYDHFYSPGVMKGRGQQAPAWDDGTGKIVGSQMFLSLGDQQPGDLNEVIGQPTDDKGAEAAYQKAFGTGASTEMADGRAVASDTKQPFTPAQTKTYQILAKGMLLDPKKPEGDVERPWMQRNPTDTFAPGHFYIATDGTLRQQSGLPDRAGFKTGFVESPNDLMASLARVTPFSDDSTLGNQARGNALIYNAQHGNNPSAAMGRLTGTLLTATPALLAGGEGAGMAAGAVSDAIPAVAPVARFLAGTASTFKSNPLLWTASKAAVGAQQGALGGALTSGQYDAPVGDLIRRDAEAGALIGPLIPAIGGAINGVTGGARAIVEPFSEAGRNRIVNRFIAERAQGGPTAMDLTEHVPGSTPTLAQATANPGLATLERSVKASNPTPFAAISQGNQQARELAVDAMRGDRQSLDDLVTHRASQTDPLREAAFANAQPTDPKPVIDAIDAALASPSGQRDAVQSALTNIRAKLVNPDGAMQTDPEQLWGVRMAIGDMLSPLSAGTKSDGRLASRELMSVRDALDPVIENGAPGFKGYLKSYADASKAVNSQEFLQGLKLTDSQGNITLGRVDSGLTRIAAMRAKGGANPAKDIPDDTMQKLYALRDDLRRQANSELGRGSGSDTVQKLGTNQLLDTLSIPAALGIGISHPLAGAAVGLGRMAYGAKNKELFNLLTGKLTDPTMAPALDQIYAPAAVPNRLISMAARAPRTAANVGVNQLLGAPGT